MSWHITITDTAGTLFDEVFEGSVDEAILTAVESSGVKSFDEGTFTLVAEAE